MIILRFSGPSVITCSDITSRVMTTPSFVETLQGAISEEGGIAIFQAHVAGEVS